MITTKKAIEIIEQMYCVLMMSKKVNIQSAITTANIHEEVRELVVKIMVNVKDGEYGH